MFYVESYLYCAVFISGAGLLISIVCKAVQKKRRGGRFTRREYAQNVMALALSALLIYMGYANGRYGFPLWFRQLHYIYNSNTLTVSYGNQSESVDMKEWFPDEMDAENFRVIPARYHEMNHFRLRDYETIRLSKLSFYKDKQKQASLLLLRVTPGTAIQEEYADRIFFTVNGQSYLFVNDFWLFRNKAVQLAPDFANRLISGLLAITS